ncbi:c-type cytochrome biogenesis protein CcmI, partial [Pseudomonas aeruginosa]|uniref:c-type cytochrome biogenesis protein CcmI n=1 Tax=Pseudomonas aeruginosa TaxID=287 RepID=UPI000F78A28B
MIDFWLAAGLLLLAALAFLLIPLLRGRRAQAEEDRTALNVALYQERIAELAGQQAAGTLTAEQLENGRAEAARELLADTEGSGEERSSRLGRAIPLVAALLVPLVALGLYLHWGASDKVELAREFAQAPHSMEEMSPRRGRAGQAPPASPPGGVLRGRADKAQERGAAAARGGARAAAR